MTGERTSGAHAPAAGARPRMGCGRHRHCTIRLRPAPCSSARPPGYAESEKEVPVMEDVLIVGAGPAGLVTAAELALAGVRRRVLERRAERSGWSRAFGLHARTLELLEARGLAEPLVEPWCGPPKTAATPRA